MALVVGDCQSDMPMFVQMPPGLEEGLLAQGLVPPPPGLPQRVPLGAPPVAPPPGLERQFIGIRDSLSPLASSDQACQSLAASNVSTMPSTPEAPSSPGDAKKSPGTPLMLSEALASNSCTSLDEDTLSTQPMFDLLADEAEAEAILRPVLNDVLGKGQLRGKGMKQSAGNCSRARWWSRPDLPLLCPLTRFPICLLPYPPFKLRIDPKRSSPHRLVDGKFLAIHYIATGSASACGRELEASDLNALDDYVHRCKLGPYRPGRAAALAEEAAAADTPQKRQQAAEERERYVAAARAELGKLRRIQENRLLQISKALPAGVAGQRTQAGRSRISSGASTVSTAASSNGDF